jgi:hypothetical protein
MAKFQTKNQPFFFDACFFDIYLNIWKMVERKESNPRPFGSDAVTTKATDRQDNMFCRTKLTGMSK